MKRMIICLCILVIAVSLAACGGNDGSPSSGQRNGDMKAKIEDPSGSILVAYFTRAGNIGETEGLDATTSASINLRDGTYAGNTELLARWIQSAVGGDLSLIQVKEPYSPDYDKTVDRAEEEKDKKARPELVSHVANMEDYDIVFLGFPNWWYDMPMAVYSFLEEYDLSGKTVIPFCTSGGSGFSDSLDTIRSMQPDIQLLQGLEIPGDNAPGAREDVNEWLEQLGFSQSEKEAEMKLSIQVGSKLYDAELLNSETTQALVKQLPMTVEMQELNGNEKHCNLPEELPVNEQKVKNIHAGDLMLFGSDSLVLFYEDFATSYSYTRLGHIEDVSGLAEAVGSGAVQVVFTAD